MDTGRKRAIDYVPKEQSSAIMSESRRSGDDIPVTFTCSVGALRELLKCVEDCYRRWPGGDPNEQVILENMRASLYVILYDTLLENDLV